MAKQDLGEQLDLLVAAILASPGVDLPEISARFSPLARITVELLVLPSENFKLALKTDLQRRANMATTAATAVKHIPEGYRTVTPYLTVQKAPELLEFVQRALGGELLYQGTGSAGGMHAEVRIGDSRMMIGGGAPTRAHGSLRQFT
jgi:hypothetical protein